MKIAYLIIAHNHAMHLQRLVTALSSSASACFIHLDRKSRWQDFSSLSSKYDNLYFSPKRVSVYWGDFSMLEATIILLRMALESEHRFDYFVLLSGADYPLQSATYIENFFERNKGAEYMELAPMPCHAIGKPLSRLTTYQPRPYNLYSYVIKLARKVSVKSGIGEVERDYRPYLEGLTPYGGSMWWALSHEACAHIVNFLDREKRVVNFYKNTVVPDETLIQTIIGNSPYRAKIQRCLTYADWSPDGPHPALITKKHLAYFRSMRQITVSDDLFGSGELLFARKFSDESAEIVRELDQIIYERSLDQLVEQG
jgi:hypothetical protein